MVADHSRIPILGDKEGFHPYLEDKINLLYADGHVTKEVRFFTDK
jgi:prepilin-type processing-associated H-X9-DG protein